MKKFLLVLGVCLVCTGAATADETPAAPPAVSAELRAACEADVTKLCAGVQPGGGRILQCLAQHKSEVSDGCKQAIAKARQNKT